MPIKHGFAIPTKIIGGRKYKFMIRETKFYAKRAARIYRDEGYRARIIKGDRYGEWEVWRSINKIK